jgi:hypothetical protein
MLPRDLVRTRMGSDIPESDSEADEDKGTYYLVNVYVNDYILRVVVKRK